MAQTELQSIKIMGDGSASGGEYEVIKVTGQGTITGESSAQKVRVIGDCTLKGNSSVEHLLHLTGKVCIDGSLKGDFIKGTGELSVTNSIQANDLQMRGFVRSSGNVELESMDLKGGFEIDGLLNVGDLSVNLQVAASKVNEIGGEAITIKSKSLFNKPYSLNVQVIEGDSIYLEYTHAKVVRGNHVHIGPGCQIERVEYRSSIKGKPNHTKHVMDIRQI